MLRYCYFAVNFYASISQTEYLTMTVKELSAKAAPEATTRGTRFPGNDLKTCVEVPRLLHIKGGGRATPDQMAAHLGYKGTNNGAYLTKIAATISFGLISKVGPVFVPTPLAHQILSPTYPHDAKNALVEAFLNVPLFKKIYEDFKGKELPPEFGMKNALKLQYGVAANRVSEAYKSLIDSADTAGFFETKNGARTHLILPLIQPIVGAAATPLAGDKPAQEFGGGGGGNNPPPKNPPADAVGDAKAKYLAALIKMFEKGVEEGALDEKLMERIERLIGAAPQTPTGN